MIAGHPLIGRERELAALDAALDRAVAGQGGVLLVVGEAGAGKTALLDALLDRATGAPARSRATGLLTAWSTAPDAEGAPPFYPWSSLLDDLAAGHPDSPLTAAATALTEPGDPAAPAEQARFRAFDRVARALRALPAPAVLVLDDLHWADGGTLRLAEFLAPLLRRTAVLLVLGARPLPDLAPTFGALIHAGATRLDLAPWSAAEVAAALDRFSVQADPAALATLHRATGGNPFFVTEMARTAQHAGGRIDPTRVPPSVVDVLGAEARRLDPAILDLLRLAAAWGQGAPLELLAAATEHPPAALLAPAADRFLAPGHPAAITFRHDLIREAIYQGMPEPDRLRLHARLAGAVSRSALPAADRTRQVAVHGCRAGSLWDPSAAVAAALAAARDALAMHAAESAVTYLDLAQSVLPLCPPDPARDLASYLTHGDALTRAGIRDRAGAALSQAVALARDLDDTEALARIALIIGLGTESAGITDREVSALLDEALARLPAGQHGLRSRLLARRAWQALAESDVHTLRATAQVAVDEARRTADPGTIAYALNAYFISIVDLDMDARRNAAQELTAQAARANDLDLQFSGLLWQTQSAMESGDFAAARAAARRYRDLAERWPLPYHAWYRWVLAAALALVEDRLDAAAVAIDSFDPDQTTQPVYARLLHTAQRMELAARRGDRAGFAPLVAALLPYLVNTPSYDATEAHLAACLGEEDRSSAALDRAIAGLDRGPTDNDWLMTLGQAALAAIRLNARHHAPTLVEHLLPFRDRWVIIGNATLVYGPVVGMLAALSRMAGDAAAAEAYAAEAEAAVRRAETPGALAALDGPSWLRTPAAPPPGHQPSGLSPREAEVLSLLAAGLSNQEIADRLILSVRTVQRHVENIYAKTGARGRAAASVFAATHGIIARDDA